MFVDSHCHLHLIDYDTLKSSMLEVISAAKENQIEQMLCVATHIDQAEILAEISQEYACVKTSIGLHPNEEIANEPTVETYLSLQEDSSIIAIGETGLDYYRLTGEPTLQQERLRRQIEVAKICQKPLIIHTRQAKADTIEILRKENAREVGGVLHCFTEDWEMAKAGMDLGFYISLSGIVTFKNAVELQDVAKKMPLDRLLIETDSPYLAPVPKRGKTNQPAYVKHVAEFLAKLRGDSVDNIAQQTTDNYYRLFQKAKS